MEEHGSKKTKSRIWTIPNVLSFFRLALIPVFIWLYCVRGDDAATAAVLVLSGLTDIADGFIARRFHMASALGKALDPVADKLTQGAMLLCLLIRFPLMALPLALLVLKEIWTGLTGLLIIRRTGRVYGADWHGKITTCLLYAAMITHVLWRDIPAAVSAALIIACVAVMLLSLVLYSARNLRILSAAKREKKEEETSA